MRRKSIFVLTVLAALLLGSCGQQPTQASVIPGTAAEYQVQDSDLSTEGDAPMPDEQSDAADDITAVDSTIVNKDEIKENSPDAYSEEQIQRTDSSEEMHTGGKSSSFKTTESIRAAYYAELKGMEGQYLSRLSAILSQGKSLSTISQAMALQSECDAKVESVLSRMSSELAANGGDLSAVAELRGMYNAEKARVAGSYLSNKH